MIFGTQCIMNFHNDNCRPNHFPYYCNGNKHHKKHRRPKTHTSPLPSEVNKKTVVQRCTTYGP